jgi:LPPG:FO 2-phospho-L-lactate transferase
MNVMVLAGGTGAAKLLDGLYRVHGPHEVSAIANVGDDIDCHGLYACPDFDMIAYMLAGLLDSEKGWGIAGDTYACFDALEQFCPGDTWFRVGDRDIATHLFRTQLLKQGFTLAQACRKVLDAIHVDMQIFPATNDVLRTIVCTETTPGGIEFQDYFVHQGAMPRVTEIRFDGASGAQPPTELLDAMAHVDRFVIGPSNPYLSIDPILSVKGIVDVLIRRREDVAFVSPVVAGQSLKGPTAKIMAELGVDVSCVTVAEKYLPVAGIAIIDEQDRETEQEIKNLGYRVHVFDTVMDSKEKREQLASAVLDVLGS